MRLPPHVPGNGGSGSWEWVPRHMGLRTASHAFKGTFTPPRSHSLSPPAVHVLQNLFTVAGGSPAHEAVTGETGNKWPHVPRARPLVYPLASTPKATPARAAPAPGGRTLDGRGHPVPGQRVQLSR